MMHFYWISGLPVTSEIDLPGMIARSADGAVPDVAIRKGKVPANLPDATLRGPTWELDDKSFLLRIANIAHFLIRDGREILVQLEPGATDRDASVFLIGTVFGILLHQRGRIVLHASAIRVAGRAVLFCGVSGAGKSTLAAALTQRGYDLVSDDICALTLDGDGPPLVNPDGRQSKLWAHSIERLELEAQQGVAVREALQKYYVEPGEAFSETLSLGAIYMLREARLPHDEGIEPLNVVDAAMSFSRNAYRPLLVARMKHKGAYLQAASRVTATGGIYQLSRKMDFAVMGAVIDKLERHWRDIGLITEHD